MFLALVLFVCCIVVPLQVLHQKVDMMTNKFARALLTIVILCGFSIASGSASVVIKKAERTIDISSQLIKVNAIITYENNDANPISSILFSSDPEWKGDLSFIGAKVITEEIVGM